MWTDLTIPLKKKGVLNFNTKYKQKANFFYTQINPINLILMGFVRINQPVK
jgi:hypothetical protein